MDFQKLVEGINKLLAAMGAPLLPTEGENAVTEETFEQAFALVLSVAVPEGTEEATTETGESSTAPAADPAAPSPEEEVQLGNRLKNLEQTMVRLGNVVEALASRPGLTGEAAYRARLGELTAGGLPGAVASLALQVGPGNGWSIDKLNALASDIPGVQLGSKIGGNVNPKAPAVPGTFQPLSEDDVNDELSKMGIRKKTA